MDAIVETILNSLREWAQDATSQAAGHWESIYLFGSVTNPDSGRFNPRESDIDLLAVFHSSCNLPYERVQACTGLLGHLQILETRLVTIGLSSTANQPIVSCGAFAQFELDLGVNTSYDPQWLVRNRFLDLSSNSIARSLRDNVIDLPSTSADAVNVLVKCNEYRKRFLSISATGSRQVNAFQSGDPILKGVGRTAVRMMGGGSTDLSYDPPTGLRHLLRLLDTFDGEIYSEAARKLTSAIEGRPQEIGVEKQLLIWEVLAHEAKSRLTAAAAAAAAAAAPDLVLGVADIGTDLSSSQSALAFNYYRENRYTLTRIARSYYDGVAHPDYPVVTRHQFLPTSPILWAPARTY